MLAIRQGIEAAPANNRPVIVEQIINRNTQITLIVVGILATLCFVAGVYLATMGTKRASYYAAGISFVAFVALTVWNVSTYLHIRKTPAPAAPEVNAPPPIANVIDNENELDSVLQEYHLNPSQAAGEHAALLASHPQVVAQLYSERMPNGAMRSILVEMESDVEHSHPDLIEGMVERLKSNELHLASHFPCTLAKLVTSEAYAEKSLRDLVTPMSSLHQSIFMAKIPYHHFAALFSEFAASIEMPLFAKNCKPERLRQFADLACAHEMKHPPSLIYIADHVKTLSVETARFILSNLQDDSPSAVRCIQFIPPPYEERGSDEELIGKHMQGLAQHVNEHHLTEDALHYYHGLPPLLRESFVHVLSPEILKTFLPELFKTEKEEALKFIAQHKEIVDSMKAKIKPILAGYIEGNVHLEIAALFPTLIASLVNETSDMNFSKYHPCYKKMKGDGAKELFVSQIQAFRQQLVLNSFLNMNNPYPPEYYLPAFQYALNLIVSIHNVGDFRRGFEERTAENRKLGNALTHSQQQFSNMLHAHPSASSSPIISLAHQPDDAASGDGSSITQEVRELARSASAEGLLGAHETEGVEEDHLKRVPSEEGLHMTHHHESVVHEEGNPLESSLESPPAEGGDMSLYPTITPPPPSDSRSRSGSDSVDVITDAEKREAVAASPKG